MNCWAENYSVMATWVPLGSSPGLPPSCSNSLTSLLPNSYPPWWFPMGLQLIQLSEHTLTICFEVFFSPSTIRATARLLHYPNAPLPNSAISPDNASITFWVWNRPSGKTISALNPRAGRGGRVGERGGVNEGRERGEDQRGEAVKRREE